MATSNPPRAFVKQLPDGWAVVFVSKTGNRVPGPHRFNSSEEAQKKLAAYINGTA